MEHEKREYVRFYIITHQHIDYQRNKHKTLTRTAPSGIPPYARHHAKEAFLQRQTGFSAHRNSLSRNAKKRNLHANNRKTVEQRSDNCKTTRAERRCDIPAVARRYMQNSPFHRCPAADRKGGTTHRNVKKRCHIC